MVDRNIEPPAGEIKAVGQRGVWNITPASQHMLAAARQFQSSGEHRMALLFAHIACELHTEYAFIQLLNRHPDAIVVNGIWALLEKITLTFKDDRVLTLFSRLTNDDNPRKTVWWETWRDSRKLRESVAHRGTMMTADQGAKAIEVAELYIKHITSVVETSPKQP